MSTSPAIEKALRDAMARLIAGKPRTTDGKLTKEILYRKAGISRATMNRATEILGPAGTDGDMAGYGSAPVHQVAASTGPQAP